MKVFLILEAVSQKKERWDEVQLQLYDKLTSEHALSLVAIPTFFFPVLYFKLS